MPVISAKVLDTWTPGNAPADMQKAPFLLVYGGDEGGVSALCADLFHGKVSPRILQADGLSAQDIRAHLSTGGLFGDPAPLRITDAGEKHLKLLKACFENLAPSAQVVVEAGALKKESKLKAFFESIGSSVVLHPLDSKAASAWMGKAIHANNATIDSKTLALVAGRLPSDRMRLTRMAETLALHALGENRTIVQEADFDALMGNESDVDLTQAMLHALDGQLDSALISLDAQLSAGENPIALLRAWSWKLQRIDDMVRANTSPASAVASARPPVFFSERPLMTRVLTRIKKDSVATALCQMDLTEQAIVFKGHNPRVAMERFVLKLASLKG